MTASTDPHSSVNAADGFISWDHLKLRHGLHQLAALLSAISSVIRIALRSHSASVSARTLKLIGSSRYRLASSYAPFSAAPRLNRLMRGISYAWLHQFNCAAARWVNASRLRRARCAITPRPKSVNRSNMPPRPSVNHVYAPRLSVNRMLRLSFGSPFGSPRLHRFSRMALSAHSSAATCAAPQPHRLAAA
jgi:hypothetical protein